LSGIGGWTGEQIAKELGWSEAHITRYGSIKAQLHPKVWDVARNPLPKTATLVNDKAEEFGNQELPIVNWRESLVWAKLAEAKWAGT